MLSKNNWVIKYTRYYRSLQQHTEDSQGQSLSTNQGVKVNDDQKEHLYY